MEHFRTNLLRQLLRAALYRESPEEDSMRKASRKLRPIQVDSLLRWQI